MLLQFREPKKLGDEGGGVSRISAEKTLCHSAEKSVGESFTVASISGIEKVCIRGGSITIFCRKSFLSQCGNFLWGNPLLLH